MLCPKCGMEVADGESVCPFCNEELTPAESTSESETADTESTESSTVEEPVAEETDSGEDKTELKSESVKESAEAKPVEDKPAKKSKMPLLIAAVVGAVAVVALVLILVLGGASHTEHSFGDWFVTKNPTCAEEGIEVRKCECGETESRTIAAVGHSFVEANCETPKTCKNCNITVGDPLGHSYTVVSNGDGTHTKTCVRNTEHTIVENCFGGTGDCESRPVCDGCGSEYGAAPVHTWNGGTVLTPAGCISGGKMYFECTLCDAEKTEDITALGHDYNDVVTDPTCTENGYTTHTCKREGCAYSYADTYVDAAHSWVGERGCESGRECSVCQIVEPELGHDYKLISQTAEDCVNAATFTYKCDRCADEFTDYGAEPDGHNVDGVTAVNVLVSGCQYVQTYVCLDCGATVNGDTVYNHVYVASVTAEATCVSDGVKTLTCSGCGDTKTENITKNENGHKWDAGVLSGTIRTYTCTNAGCGATDTYVDASGSTSADVTAGDLANAGGVKLENADISFDSGALGTLADKDVTISSDTLSGEDLDAAMANLTEEQKAQIGSNKIYNFLVTEDGNAISQFGGKITVTLPYTLSEGEDVDSIAVWYMSGDTPVSIKAVYSNGNITFETDHFSYYTVTKLTPAERCALYGHSWTTSTVSVTCTTDGYTLSVCVRCHESKKTDVTKATGHNYLLNEDKCVKVSCTVNGKDVYDCTNCTATYFVTVKAVGHNFAEIEKVEASCEAAGYIVYSCSGCSLSYKEVIPQKKHVYSTESVPADCENYGYTLNSCDNCDYSYESDITPATGHSYDAVIVWADDYSVATLTLTCKNDSEHKVTVDAIITVKTFEGSCIAGGRVEYTAKASYNGTNYVEQKVVESGEASHKYSEEYKYDADSHWNECTECGAKNELVAHVFENGTVTREPNCTVAGEQILTCVCGATKTEEIPTNDNHSFENGTCTLCGTPEVVCDHDVLTEHEIDIATLGGCGGVIKYYSCECGKNVELQLEEDDMDFECSLGESYESEEFIDENTAKATMTAKCEDCGFFVDAYAIMKEEGCKEYYDAYYSFYMGEELLIKDAHQYAEYYGHNEQRVYIALKDYGACAGVLEAYECRDCGNIDMYTVLIKCGTTERGETVVDGIVKKYAKTTCADCGLVYTETEWTEVINECEKITHVNKELVIDGETVGTLEYSNNYNGHSYEREYKLLGDSCEDGYERTDYCKKCGTTKVYKGKGHYEEWTEIDLSEYTSCGWLVARGYKCAICEELIDVQTNYDSSCNFGKPVIENKTVDGIAHTITTRTCRDCGIVVVIDNYKEQADGCEYKIYDTITFIKNGENVFSGAFERETEEHEYVYSSTGTDCESTHVITRECKKCGAKESWQTSSHYYQYITIDLSEYTSCAGKFGVEKCAVCGNITYVDTGYFECDFSANTDEGTYQDADGNTRMYMQASCVDCGMTVRMERWEIVTNACTPKQHQLIRLTYGGTVIHEYQGFVEYEEHDYQYSYTIIGDDCTEGYKIVKVCSICGDTEISYSKEHKQQTMYVNLSEYGLCGGEASVVYCEVCNKTIHSNANDYQCRWTKISSDATTTLYRCKNCGVERTTVNTVTGPDANCWYSETRSIIYRKDGAEVYSTEYTYEYISHKYTYTYVLEGDSCEDGVTIISTCTHCGNVYESTYDWHYTISLFSYDLSEYGVCGGRYYSSACPCGERIDVYTEFYCNMSYNTNTYVDEQGVTHHVVSRVCSECGFRYQEDSYEVIDRANCSKTTYYVATLSKGETLICEKEYSRTEENHDYVITATLNPGAVTCRDGVKITYSCAVCNHSYTNQIDWHQNIVVKSINLADYGSVCGGYLNELKCACGEEHRVSYDDALCDFACYNIEWYNSDNFIEDYICGVTHPSQCGFTMRHSRYTKTESGSCFAKVMESWKIGYNAATGEFAYEIVFETGRYASNHNYEYEWTDVINADGNKETMSYYSCTKCDAYYYRKDVYTADGNYQLMWQEYKYDPKNPSNHTYYNEIEKYTTHTALDGTKFHYKTYYLYEYSYLNGLNNRSEEVYTRTWDYTSPWGTEGYTEVMVRSSKDENYTKTRNVGLNKGYEYTVYEHFENKENDYWYTREYTYYFDNNCYYEYTETNSYGEKYTGNGNAHRTSYQRVSYPTCSQPGVYGYYCNVCGTCESSYMESPYDHHFRWNAAKQTYVCNRCGLENANGSSGSVVMEDLSEKCGDGKNYVIGYWDKNELSFTYYVSIVKSDGTEITIDVLIQECTDVRGYYFSKQDVVAAASAAGLAEGTYSVRFTAVPYGADGNFDYAITLE